MIGSYIGSRRHGSAWVDSTIEAYEVDGQALTELYPALKYILG